MKPILDVNIDNQDIAIVVSASGEIGPGASAGASAVMIDTTTQSRTRFVSGGTLVNIRFMDVTAIAAALRYHQTKLANEDRVYRVLIVTDNFELIREAETGECNSYEWSMLNWFIANGYDLQWAWQSCLAAGSQKNVTEAKAIRSVVREAAAWNTL